MNSAIIRIGDSMSSIYFSTAAFFCELLIIILFFFKDRFKSTETKLYGFMLISSFVDIILVITELFLTYYCDISFVNVIVVLLNKIDFVHYIIWPTLMFLYILYISTSDINKYNKIKRFCFIFDIFLIMIEFALPIQIIKHSDSMGVTGYGATFIYFCALGYFLAVVVVLVINMKNITNKKYIPFLVLLPLMIIACIVRIVNPMLIVIPAIITYINLIMFFTIENPDIKMLEEVTLAKIQAEKANRAKTDFLSSMSHEIRTPLNAIVGFSDCIIDANLLDEAKENAKDIVSASQTLLEIVNGILDISKIEAGKIEIINSKYDAQEMFLELAKLIMPKMNEKGLDFTYKISPEIPKTLFGDNANLKKIVTNLLSNACKYTDKGYVHYEVNCINIKDVSKLIISVEDSGHGIKQENVDKLFTKFERLEEDKNSTIEGTGLGLAITKQLIELMGGRIVVHTVYGEGSKFTVILNQRIEEMDVVEEKVVNDSLDLKDISILLVDDTELNLKVACKLLEKFNANKITSVNSGFACIDKIKNNNQYDLILLDDMMPKMSGVETLKKLKEIPGFDIPTIALTANAITGMREKYLADGFDGYLAKPIEKDQLISVVNKIISERNNNSTSNSDDSSVDNTEIEQLEDFLDINDIDLIPVVDISNDKVQEKVYDKKYLEDNGVDFNYSLELLGDMEMYDSTINDFYDEVEDKWKRILEYKDNKDMANYAIEVHSLKSDCKYLGFLELADISYQHELKSKDNDIDYVIENFPHLEQEYRRVLEVVKNYINK
jgi:signal transduction histidine kinase/FixJ family two-component response regulator